jgi:hypothetical protein
MALSYTETCSIYQGRTVTLPDGNEVPAAQTLVTGGANLPCNFHRGTTSAIDAATLLGVQSRLVALVYFPLTPAETLIKDRSVLLHSDSSAWVVRDVPATHSRFVATSHVKVLAELLNVRPNGLPPIS